MSTVAIVAFLVAHGLLHAGIWLAPQPAADRPPPFTPDHSALLTVAAFPQPLVHRVATGLAALTTAVYLVAAVAVGTGVDWATPAAATGAVLGLVLKSVYFHPWLSLGVLLDVLVLSAALSQWPVTLP